MTAAQILSAIAKKEIKKQDAAPYFKSAGFSYEICDINAAEFHLSQGVRYTIQDVEVPAKKRGNLGKYAGKKCEVIFTNIAQSGARACFWIREAK